jgi:hypothetical protein
MSGGTDLKIHVLVRNFQHIKEVIRHSIIIMLTRMNEAKLQPVFVLEFPNQGGYLHKVGPCPYDQVQNILALCGNVSLHLFELLELKHVSFGYAEHR